MVKKNSLLKDVVAREKKFEKFIELHP